MLLVTGAASIVGRHVVHELGDAHVPHRAMVPSKSAIAPMDAEGCEFVVGALDNGRELERALDGVTGIILITRAHPNQVALERMLLSAAQRHGVQRVIKMSSVGASQSARFNVGRWHWEIEQLLATTPLEWVVVRAHRPMQHVYAQLSSLLSQHAFYGCQGDGASADVDVRDVAAVLARTAIDAQYAREVIEISGPAAVTPQDTADALGVGMGVPVAYVDCTPDEFVRGQLAAGLEQWRAEGRAAWQSAARDGHCATVSDHVSRILGRPPRTLASFAAEFAAAVRYFRAPPSRRAPPSEQHAHAHLEGTQAP